MVTQDVCRSCSGAVPNLSNYPCKLPLAWYTPSLLALRITACRVEAKYCNRKQEGSLQRSHFKAVQSNMLSALPEVVMHPLEGCLMHQPYVTKMRQRNSPQTKAAAHEFEGPACGSGTLAPA
eukprot:1138300-Pelagomonas_calceolata.AAC.12